MNDRLKVGCEKLGLELSEQQITALMIYLKTLHQWNQVHHFTAVHSIQAMISLHVLDSLSAAPYILGERIADVGSGPGLPGIPLAIYFPCKEFILIEANAKRVSFLRHMQATLSLKNVEIIHGRVPEISLLPMDQILSRAFASLEDFLEVTAYLLKEEGSWLAFIGKWDPAQLEALSFKCTWQRYVVCLPYEQERARNLLLLQRRSIMPLDHLK